MLEQLLLALFGIYTEPPAQVEMKSRADVVVVSRSRDFVDYAKQKINNETEFKCFDELMHRESSWRTRKDPQFADNPNSSAYGIPQALPGKKMASAGHDWATNPITQIRWAIGYIEDRYQTSCKALKFHDERGYY
jgi:hypothetical protein